ncbi:O-antigen ligase family protein [Curvivirga sp.]|uniref:O-antigen ligase family protein n=1 Tax=Curvivirga sp. TaxID=2856848 RepID=UPI003B5A72D2
MKLHGLHNRSTQVIFALLGSLFLVLPWYVISHPAIPVALALIPILIFVALRYPFLMVLGFLIFSFFRIHEVFPQLYPLRIPQMLALGTIASLAFNLMTKRIEVYWRSEFSIFCVFFILVTLGVFLATNRGEAMSSWSGTYVKIAIMVFAISWLSQDTRAFKIMLYSILIAGLIVGYVTIYNKMNGIGLVEGTRATIGRDLGSLLGDPNDLALVLLFPASFALALVFTSGTGWGTKMLGVICFITMISAIIATQSRGGLLGITSVMAVFGYRKIKSKALFFSIGLICLMILFAVAGISDRASGGAHEAGIDESSMGRLHAWDAAIGMALSHPISGVGINNFLSNYYMYSDFWDGKNHAVHSTWFGVLAETGLIGFMIFISLIFTLIRNGLKTLQRLEKTDEVVANIVAYAVFAGLIGFCVSGTFLTMGFTWPVYILLSLGVAISRYSEKLVHQKKY